MLLVRYEGLNFSRFLGFCVKHNVEIRDVEIKSHKEIFFKVSARDYKHTLLKVKNKWYNIIMKSKGAELCKKLTGLIEVWE